MTIHVDKIKRSAILNTEFFGQEAFIHWIGPPLYLHYFSPRRIYCRVLKFCMGFMSHVDGRLRGGSRMHIPGSEGPHQRW